MLTNLTRFKDEGEGSKNRREKELFLKEYYEIITQYLEKRLLSCQKGAMLQIHAYVCA